MVLLLFSCSVLSDSLLPFGLQHARLPCPSLSPRNLLKLMPTESTMPSSVSPFSSCPPSSPASGSFPMSQLFASGGQSIGASASASVLLINIQGWFPLGFSGLVQIFSVGEESACNAENTSSIPGSGRSTGGGIGYPLQDSWASLVAQLVKNLPDLLAVQWALWSLLQHHSSKALILLTLNFLYGPTPTSIYDYWKNHSFDYTDMKTGTDTLLAKWCLCFLIHCLGLS